MRRFDNDYSNTKIIEGFAAETESLTDQDLDQVITTSTLAEQQQQQIAADLRNIENVDTGAYESVMDTYIFNLGSKLQTSEINNMNSLAPTTVEKLIATANTNIVNLMNTLDLDTSGNNSKQAAKISELLDTYTDNIKLIGLNMLINYDTINIVPGMLHYYIDKYKDIMLILNDFKAHLKGKPGFFSKSSDSGGGDGLFGGLFSIF